MSKLPIVAKAVAGGATAFAGALATALSDGTVAPAEWVGVVMAAAVAAFAVWRTPNVAVAGEDAAGSDA